MGGDSVSEARHLVFAVKWFLDLDNSQLRGALRTLSGFRAMCPEGTRDPNPFEAVVLGAYHLVLKGTMTAIYAAAASLISFDTYCRPGE
eukprot:11700819-Heterocapsa_arctica.AAC.1